MKVGIVTVFDNNNHGNRLQNYALQQVLAHYADQVVTMKNKPWYSKKSRIARMLPLAESAFLNRVLGMERRAKIVEFTNRHIQLSRGCYWYDKCGQAPKKADCCDVYCAGSDQIWNPTMGRRGTFDYLMFAPAERTFSYAASFGIDEIPEQYRSAVAEGLKHIRHISVREDAGKQIVEGLTAPVAAGDPLGTLTVTSGGETVASIPIVAGETVERLTFGQVFGQLLKMALMAG